MSKLEMSIKNCLCQVKGHSLNRTEMAIIVAEFCKYAIFVAKISKYCIFVAKILKYALYDCLQGSAAFLNSAAN